MNFALHRYDSTLAGSFLGLPSSGLRLGFPIRARLLTQPGPTTWHRSSTQCNRSTCGYAAPRAAIWKTESGGFPTADRAYRSFRWALGTATGEHQINDAEQ
jgi:hypothetical protein